MPCISRKWFFMYSSVKTSEQYWHFWPSCTLELMWARNPCSDANPLLQTSQKTFSSSSKLCTRFRWFLRDSFSLNRSPHMSQPYGVSLVWVRQWVTRCVLLLKSLPQYSHLCGRSFLWIPSTCRFKCTVKIKGDLDLVCLSFVHQYTYFFGRISFRICYIPSRARRRVLFCRVNPAHALICTFYRIYHRYNRVWTSASRVCDIVNLEYS